MKIGKPTENHKRFCPGDFSSWYAGGTKFRNNLPGSIRIKDYEIEIIIR